MLKFKVLFAGIFLIGFLVTGHQNTVQQHPYTGRFILNSGQVTLTLNLTQHVNNKVTGTLTSSNGTVFQVNGTFEGNGTATGTCTSDGGRVFFEAYIEGNELTFSLIEADANNQPDYDKARYLVFNRQAANPSSGVNVFASGNAGTGNNRTSNQQTQQQVPQDQYQNSQQYAQQPSQQYASRPQQQTQPAYTGNQAAAAGEVGDDMLGFRFVPPQGWVTQKTQNGFMVGHNSVPGMIVVFPHTASNMQMMQSEMMQGIREDGTSLRASGSMQQVSNNVLGVDYSGIVNGQQVKGKGYGTLSPNSGGVYILALSTPDKMSNDLMAAARQIATHVRFVRPSAGGSSDLMQFFADTWVTTTTNTASYVTLYADGTWTDNSETSYSGNFTDGGGNNTGSWGNAGQQQSRGRWSVSGTRDQGQLTTISANGERNVYQYRVHVENGQKYYSEYFFNGTLFHRKNKYD